MPIRFDTFKNEKYERTPSGGLIIPATLARTGVLEYHTDSGTIREYRSPDEVFGETSMNSVANAPVTDLHPEDFVTPSTYAELAKGHVGEQIEKTDAHIQANVVITDADMIRKIESGERSEISPGYMVQIDPTPGETPEGERYDQRQVNIPHNHFALLPTGHGRSGPEVALRLDSNGNELMEHKMSEKETENRTDMLEKLVSERDELKGRCDSLEEELTQVKADLEVAQDPKAMSERVDARMKLEKRAHELDSDLKLDGLSDLEVMIASLGKDFDPEGKSEDYIRGRFDAAKPRIDAVTQARIDQRLLKNHR